MERNYIPRYLSAQPQLLWWELDEIMFLLSFTAVGIIAGKMAIFAIIGFIVMRFYGKLKYSRQDGYLKHFFYRLGLYNAPGRRFPEYWIKEIVK